MQNIAELFLFSGSLWLLQIKRLLANLFGKEKICDTVNPDEVVAYGAAVHAASLSGLSDVTLLDVTSHSLGVATLGDVQVNHCLKSQDHMVSHPAELQSTRCSDAPDTFACIVPRYLHLLANNICESGEGQYLH